MWRQNLSRRGIHLRPSRLSLRALSSSHSTSNPRLGPGLGCGLGLGLGLTSKSGFFYDLIPKVLVQPPEERLGSGLELGLGLRSEAGSPEIVLECTDKPGLKPSSRLEYRLRVEVNSKPGEVRSGIREQVLGLGLGLGLDLGSTAKDGRPWVLQGRRRMSGTGGQDGEREGGGVSGKVGSWFSRLVETLSPGGGKKAVEETEEGLSMDQYADQLKKARNFGSIAQFGRGLPRGGEALVARSLDRQEAIIKAMRPEERTDLKKFKTEARARVAAECGCTVADVGNVVSKYEWFRDADKKVRQLKKEGKPLPRTMQDIEKLMGSSWNPSASRALTGAPGEQPSRNAPCSCGSGKKYKRCCGASNPN